jgi:hypothetical protein
MLTELMFEAFYASPRNEAKGIVRPINTRNTRTHFSSEAPGTPKKAPTVTVMGKATGTVHPWNFWQ